MKTIALTQGRFAMVDDQDYEWLLSWKWRAKRVHSSKRELWYACSCMGTHDRYELMHRTIMLHCGHPSKLWCDHKDGNGLNNTRDNLRFGPPCQNNWNRCKHANGTSQYKGVFWHKRDKIWVSAIMAHGKKEWLGFFDKEQDAANAYDEAAKRLHGEFARLNSPSTD